MTRQDCCPQIRYHLVEQQKSAEWSHGGRLQRLRKRMRYFERGHSWVGGTDLDFWPAPCWTGVVWITGKDGVIFVSRINLLEYEFAGCGYDKSSVRGS